MPGSSIKAERNCAVTGSTGYFGSRLCGSLDRNGWRVFRLTSSAVSEDRGQIPFTLAQGAPPNIFAQHKIQSLVHCAYDFGLRRCSDIQEHNVRGSIRLMQDARTQGVRQIIFVSTMSAFPGCKSRYGRAKLEIENEVVRLGGVVVRPGLIHGNQPGSIVGTLDKAVRSLRFVPLIGNGKQMLHAAHEEDLAALVEHLLSQKQNPTGPIIAAAEQGMSLEQILRVLAARQGKTIRLLRIPWQLVWGSLRAAELLQLPLGFRSDSVISFVNQDPAPSFARTRELGVVFRNFDVDHGSQAQAIPYFRANPSTLRKKLDSTV